ncbi:hypothetical protein BH09MYX1_BH09MYX1_06640 [soil metagenome]
MKSGRFVLGLVLVLGFGAAGCSSLGVSTRAASDEIAVAETVRSEASLAGKQCRAEAGYRYYESRLGLAEPGAKALIFPTWYKQTLADATSPWAAYCADLEKTGLVYHGGVLALRAYGRAILALAAGSDFDGSGFQRMANGVATFAGTLGAVESFGDSVRSIGASVSSISTFVEKHLRAHVLRILVNESPKLVDDLVTGLESYLDALEGQRTVVEHHRNVVLKAGELARDPSGNLPSAEDAAFAFDLATGGDRMLATTQRILVRDRQLLEKTRAMHAAFAKIPFTEKAPPELITKLQELEAALSAIADEVEE